MPDNWSFVIAAYALAAVVLGAYWRRLVRREHELTALEHRSRGRPAGSQPRPAGTGAPHRAPGARPPLP